MIFDNEMIRLHFPDGWQVQEDEEGTVFALDPTSEGVQISVELGGVRHEEEAIEPKVFLTDVYADELAAGQASFSVGDDGRILLSWDQNISHEGQHFAVSYVQVAISQSKGNLQLARFQLAIQAGTLADSTVKELQQAMLAAAENAYFYPWTE